MGSLHPLRTSDVILAIRNLTKAVVGIIAFAIVDSVITIAIRGTDTGSNFVRAILRLVLAASIIIGVVACGGGGGE